MNFQLLAHYVWEYGDLGSQLASWPQEHVVKCLVFYHPKDSIEMKTEQDATLKQVYQAAVEQDMNCY